MPLPSVFQGVQDCRLPGFKPSKPFKPFRRPFQGNNSYSYMPLPSVFHGVQDCRSPGFKPSKRRSRPPRQQLLQLHAPAICFSRGSRLPFARLQTLQTLQTVPQAFPRQQLLQLHAPAICFSWGSRLPFARLQTPQTLQTLPQAFPRLLQLHALSKATTLTATSVCPASNPPNAAAGLQGNNSYSYMMWLHAPAICFSGGSRLPFARLQTLQTHPQAFPRQ